MSNAHAALMDDVYRYQRHFYDLTREFYLLGRDHLIRSLDAGRGTVLEVGCGTGRNLIDAARANPEATFYGLDISAEMLRTAERKIARAGLSNRIHLARADATDFDLEALFGLKAVDRIIYSYALSIIPDWPEAFTTGLRQLVPGGRSLIVDFGAQQGMPKLFRRALYAWLGKFHVRPFVDEEALLEEISGRMGCRLRAYPLFRGYVWYGEARRAG